MHNTTSVKGNLWLAKGFETVAAKSGSMTHPSAFISIPLYCVTRLYGMLNWTKPGYGGIIAQSWLNMFILDCCSRKDITQSIKCLNILWWRVWRISGMIIVVRDMHFICQKTPSEVPITQSARYCLPSCLSMSTPWVASIIFCKYSQ